jgi:sporulation protein YlmC with PRC-barrel domain
MLQSANRLKGFSIHATDGELGRVEEAWFDDEGWAIRYLVVNTGGWLLGRRVLISPIAVREIEGRHHAIAVELSRQQVADSPEIDTEEPITRHHEARFFGHFGWPFYWGGASLWGAGVYPGALAAPAAAVVAEPSAPLTEAEADRERRLASTKDVTGYEVTGIDGSVGHVRDFLFDDESWEIRYLVVETGDGWAAGRALVPREWAERVDWPGREILVDVDRAAIRSAPEWGGEAITADLERRLREHYHRSGADAQRLAA